MIALGRALRARGHDVTLETWQGWRSHAEAEDLRFAEAPEYHVFPTRERPLKPYEAVARATVTTRELVAQLRPDVVVADVLTLAPALAAEIEGVPFGTLIPHVDPRPSRGFAPYSSGARLPRTAVGGRLWDRAVAPLVARGLEIGRVELNETRRRLGLGPLDRVFGGISQDLCLVATLPQLEYPRSVPEPGTHVVGPLQWEPTHDEDDPLPPGDDPLVLIAPSTSQDPSHVMLRAALEGLADAPVRDPGRLQPPPAGPPDSRPPERTAGRVVPLHAHDAVVRCRGVPRRPRHRHAGADLRLRRRRLPCSGRHERERRADRLGGRGSARAAAARRAAGVAAGDRPGARRAGVASTGAGSGGVGRRATTLGRGRRSWWRGWRGPAENTAPRPVSVRARREHLFVWRNRSLRSCWTVACRLRPLLAPQACIRRRLGIGPRRQQPGVENAERHRARGEELRARATRTAGERRPLCSRIGATVDRQPPGEPCDHWLKRTASNSTERNVAVSMAKATDQRHLPRPRSCRVRRSRGWQVALRALPRRPRGHQQAAEKGAARRKRRWPLHPLWVRPSSRSAPVPPP